jgi:SNF2 family DNA or RNA helicase
MEIKSGSKIAMPLWEHQKIGVQMGLQEAGYGFFFEVGTGKSRTVINVMRHRFAHASRILRTIILVPKIAITNWQREIIEYSKVHPLDVIPLKGAGKKRWAKFIDETKDEDLQLTKPKIFIMNYESLQMEDLMKAMKSWRPEFIIADEAHRIKNPKSKRAKELFPLSDLAAYRYALTGTPILNTPMDIFNIFKFIDRGETFGKNFYTFRSQWFEDDNAGFSGKPGYFPKFVPRPETYERFNKLIKTKSMRALKAECLDLPPLVKENIYVEMTAEQKKAYKEMERDLITFVQEAKSEGVQTKAVIAQIAATKNLRCLQILCGFAKTDTGEIHKFKENPRLEALEELLEDYAPSHKIIVWTLFHETYDDIAAVCKKLKLPFVELTGRINDKGKEEAKDAFNNDPKCRVMIANQGAGGIAINLIASNVSVYYSKDHSLEKDIQSEARNYRGGSEIHDKVTRFDLVCLGTTDELINEGLRSKKDVAEMILDWRGSDFTGNT